MTAEPLKFKSEREEAEFWDTYNTLDYLEGDEPAEIELDPDLEAKIRERQKTKRVTLRLRVSQIEAVKEIARRKDIPLSNTHTLLDSRSPGESRGGRKEGGRVGDRCFIRSAVHRRKTCQQDNSL